MLYFDSWVWLEYFSEDECWKQARSYIDKIGDTTVLVSSIVLLEVKYRFACKFTSSDADRVIRTIESFDELMVLPVTDKVAKKSADVRRQYYEPDTVEMSYGDAIHLTTARMGDCKKFITGDPDFGSITEPEVELIE